MRIPDFQGVMGSVLFGGYLPNRSLYTRKVSSHEIPPPTVPEGKEYRLPPHVIPELYALLGVNREKDDKRPRLTGVYETDVQIPCSQDTRRVIQSGFFSERFSPLGVPVWKRADNGTLVKNRYPTIGQMDEAMKELRNVGIGIILSLTLDYSKAKGESMAFNLDSAQENDATLNNQQSRRSAMLKERKIKPEEKVSKRKSKNAKRLIKSSINKEYEDFSSSLHSVLKSLRKLPTRHPLANFSTNFFILCYSNIIINRLEARNEDQFILRGLNTFQKTMLRMNRLIKTLERKQKIQLSPEQYVNAFENSAEIARTLANMHLELFSDTNRKLQGKFGRILDRYKSKYFTLQPVDKNNQDLGWRLAFSEKGNKLLNDERKKFKKTVEKRDVLTTTTRCPARRDGAAKEDDIILNLHRDIVQRARKRIVLSTIPQEVA
ncbi:MAG TPA: hypothetical protein VF189_03040 [Patescibacteria group bacterium]